MSMLDTVVRQAARTAHEVNRAWCAINGDNSQVAFDDAPADIQASAIDGVQAILSGDVTSPEQSHENWKRFKIADGWTYGPVKDAETKTHPCIVDNYEDLPEVDRHKDVLYFAVVLSFIS